MGIATQVTNKVVSRLKFPKLLALFLTLWILDMIIPDPIPFFDEIMLALATAIFGLWRERVTVPVEVEVVRPEVKNVTPPAGSV
jgi:Family of unknown function (DUF6116)